MFDLNLRDSRPIYEQLKDRLRQLIISGGIREGEQLPSVREMAAQLAINPNTIQRAYRELEHEGYVQSIPGKGCFAHKQITGDSKRMESLWEALERTVSELRFWGVTTEELMARLEGGKGND